MEPHPLYNFEIQKYYQREAKLNIFYSRNNLPKIMNGAQVINLDEYKSIGTHWIALNVNDDNVTCFDSFRAQYIPKDIEKFIGNKNMKTNIYMIQSNDSIMCYFCIGFIYYFYGRR